MNEAALAAARAGKDAVEMADFDEAIDRVIAGLERKSRVISPREKEIVAHHEASYALVAELRDQRRPRAQDLDYSARGGRARMHATRAHSGSLSHDAPSFSIGSMSSSAVALEKKSSSATSRRVRKTICRKATKMARHMVAQYGMSKRLGLATFEEPRQAFLDVPGFSPHDYSEQTARTIDEEIEAVLEAAHGRVRETLTAKRSVLESLAKLLIEKEVVDADALRTLLST